VEDGRLQGIADNLRYAQRMNVIRNIVNQVSSLALYTEADKIYYA